MAKMVLGLFPDRYEAEHAIEELEARGYNPKDMSIVMRDRHEAVEIEQSTGANMVEGVVSGAATGGVIGGLAGLLIGIGAIAVPGIGALLIGGPLAAALGLTGAAATTISGAATGVLAGGLVGALVGWGVPEEDARYYEDRIKEGSILVVVPVRLDFEDEARSVMEDHGAEQIRFVEAGTSRGIEEIEYTPAYFHDVDVGEKVSRPAKKSRKR